MMASSEQPAVGSQQLRETFPACLVSGSVPGKLLSARRVRAG